MKNIRIAIDGPASSGKSTVAKLIAKDFDIIYLDTGAMYRVATYIALCNGLSETDGTSIIGVLKENPISFGNAPEGQLVYTGEVDVTHAIRQNDVTNAVSKISAVTEIRDYLVDVQREIASHGGIVMDGRDIGTVVLPDAELKIFLVASVEERAQRRYKENLQKGIETDYDLLKFEISERDRKDTTRQVSPLKQASDAILIDTTGITISEVVSKIEDYARKV
ncbi:(d)CMP kinase [Lactococcus carnosus]|uniref:(d)CMP kinase n=1 Tax=Pseudolactococcus carnosus TaxID=2749961 RepID=UPI0015DD0B19|nr:(d)CMP kinase [Lactococcus carnosus]MCJ1987236.1 (d)CMP kinase [Lactococcus carnosus]MCJ2000058.1 (d)CMP kinase [Lactococcus carnosus]MCJ2004059.1 (d)CMP kinase [Lactococcus carnosus]QDJ26971.1 cytidylate kinase [Lactococcus carnosus]